MGEQEPSVPYVPSVPSDSFTAQQRDVLRNQVAAYKFFEALNKKVGIPQALKSEWLPLLHPLPLDSPSYSATAVKSLAADIYAYRNQVVESLKEMKRRYDKARGKDLSDQSLSDPIILSGQPLLVGSNVNISGERSFVYSPWMHGKALGDNQGNGQGCPLLVQIMKTEYQNAMQEQYRTEYRRLVGSLTPAYKAAHPGMSENPGKAVKDGSLKYGDARAQVR